GRSAGFIIPPTPHQLVTELHQTSPEYHMPGYLFDLPPEDILYHDVLEPHDKSCKINGVTTTVTWDEWNAFQKKVTRAALSARLEEDVLQARFLDPCYIHMLLAIEPFDKASAREILALARERNARMYGKLRNDYMAIDWKIRYHPRIVSSDREEGDAENNASDQEEEDLPAYSSSSGARTPSLVSEPIPAAEAEGYDANGRSATSWLRWPSLSTLTFAATLGNCLLLHRIASSLSIQGSDVATTAMHVLEKAFTDSHV
ncbi:hypothetical protein HKX48_009111, partial [Thoreauomyces humboldtii]